MDYYILQKPCLQLIRITENEFRILNEEDYDLDGDILVHFNRSEKKIIASEDVSSYWFHDFSLSLEECVHTSESKAREFIDYISDYGDNRNALWMYRGTITGDNQKYRLDDYEERI